jgi:hypothetical protein
MTTNDSGSQLTPGDADTYLEDRQRRLRRDRVAGYVVCIALWVLSVIPLARDAIDEREGAGVVLVYLAAGAISLGVAAVIRALYAILNKRRFWSPWLFLFAAVVAIAGYAIQSAGEEVVPITDGQPRESIAG